MQKRTDIAHANGSQWRFGEQTYSEAWDRDGLDHRHLDENRLLILPHMQRQFLLVIAWLFAAAGDITNTLTKSNGMGQFTSLDVYGLGTNKD